VWTEYYSTAYNKSNYKRMTREYLGALVTAANYREIKNRGGNDELKFHAKHLKAYLSGRKTFEHGYTTSASGRRTPNVYNVQLNES
jgi:hypothetical protein